MRVFLLALAACSGGQHPSAGGDCFPIVPMRMLALEHGREWEPMVELRADGKIVREHQVIATVSADRVVDRSGKTLLTCTADRKIVTDGKALAHFDADDRMIDADGSPLYVSADGRVHWMRPAGDLFGDARFEGGFARARRTAVVVVLALLAANFSRMHD